MTPTGEIVDSPLRCSFMGNRGRVHEGRDVMRPWRSRAWITCLTVAVIEAGYRPQLRSR